MLVGSFARTMFLVHSECDESSYINSRPFRVNAGPVHAYCLAGPSGRTSYLSELGTGKEVWCQRFPQPRPARACLPRCPSPTGAHGPVDE